MRWFARVIAAHPAVLSREGDKMKTRILFLIIANLLVAGCACKVEVTGVKIETLMNGRIEYYAVTDNGDKKVSEHVYGDLVYKLNHLAAGKALVCDMEKGPGGMYDMAVCFQDVIVAGVIDTNQDAQEYGQ